MNPRIAQLAPSPVSHAVVQPATPALAVHVFRVIPKTRGGGGGGGAPPLITVFCTLPSSSGASASWSGKLHPETGVVSLSLAEVHEVAVPPTLVWTALLALLPWTPWLKAVTSAATSADVLPFIWNA